MPQLAMIESIRQWLVNQTLQNADIKTLFGELCVRLSAAGIPVSRARMMWPTLHPLYAAETVRWNEGGEAELRRFEHQTNATEPWNRSPLKYVIDNKLPSLRRQLEGPNELVDFEILQELKEEGMTDYVVLFTPMADMTTSQSNFGVSQGIILTWATRRVGGFSIDHLDSLQAIQGRFAVACKSVIQRGISCNIVNAYLGVRAGNRVMDGQIKRGDGERTCAVLWYSDMRNSTHLSQTMKAEQYLDLLNSYFEATAGPVVEEGGEVLEFIGDAVLGIFPFASDEEREVAIASSIKAAQSSRDLARKINGERIARGQDGFRYGIGLNLGSIMFGNIGIPQRLSFSAIGKSVNEVARIQGLSKETGQQVVASEALVQLMPQGWTRLGKYQLAGLDGEVYIYSLDEQEEEEPPMRVAN